MQDGVGYVKGEPRIRLHLEAYLGAPESYDSVLIEGSPRIDSRIDGGVHGDIATAAMTVNSIPAVMKAAPGLRTMRDMRLPSYRVVSGFSRTCTYVRLQPDLLSYVVSGFSRTSVAGRNVSALQQNPHPLQQ